MVQQFTLKLSSLVMYTFITLILNDYVVRDHISSHHFPHGIVTPRFIWVQKNSPP
jgi:hypothetical protein